MVGVEADRERALAKSVATLQRELEELRERDGRHVRWMEAIARLAAEFQVEASTAGRDSALETLSGSSTRRMPRSPPISADSWRSPPAAVARSVWR